MLFDLSSLSLCRVCDPGGKLLASTSRVLAFASFKDLNCVHLNVSAYSSVSVENLAA